MTQTQTFTNMRKTPTFSILAKCHILQHLAVSHRLQGLCSNNSRNNQLSYINLLFNTKHPVLVFHIIDIHEGFLSLNMYRFFYKLLCINKNHILDYFNTKQINKTFNLLVPRAIISIIIN